MYSDPDIDLDFPMPERLRKVISNGIKTVWT